MPAAREEAVAVQPCGPRPFGPTAQSLMAVEVHMPQAVLGHGKALGEEHIGFTCGLDMGNSPRVAVDGDCFFKALAALSAFEVGESGLKVLDADRHCVPLALLVQDILQGKCVCRNMHIL